MFNFSTNTDINKLFSIYCEHLDNNNNNVCMNYCECYRAIEEIIYYISKNGICELYDTWSLIRNQKKFPSIFIDTIWDHINPITFYSSIYKYSIFINLCEQFWVYEDENIIFRSVKLFYANKYGFFEIFLKLKIQYNTFSFKDKLHLYFLHILSKTYRDCHISYLSVCQSELYHSNYHHSYNYILNKKKENTMFLFNILPLNKDIVSIIIDYCGIFI